jgi:hypothetical protein
MRKSKDEEEKIQKGFPELRKSGFARSNTAANRREETRKWEGAENTKEEEGGAAPARGRCQCLEEAGRLLTVSVDIRCATSVVTVDDRASPPLGSTPRNDCRRARASV